MKLKPTTYDVGQVVTVKGPRAGLIRQMIIEEIVVKISRGGKQSVRYGFRESLWLYSEGMISVKSAKDEIKKPRATQAAFDFMDDI